MTVTGNAGIANGPDKRPFMAQRGISPRTLVALGVRSGTDYYPQLNRESRGAQFRYREGYKARAIPDKAFVCSKDFKAAFWNEERVLGQLGAVFITEGEMDAMSLVEAGISANQVLSVPSGAREHVSKDPFNSRAYRYVEEALNNGLSKMPKFIWCGDSDGPGIALRADMAMILGEARFRFVEWPDGIKDANEMLVKDGPQALLELVRDGSMEWPVDGLYKLSEMPELPPLQVWDPGFGWGGKIRLARRTLSVATGTPGSGKTMFFAQAFFNIVKNNMTPACIATFETRAKPHYRRILRQLYNKKLEQYQSDKERREADEWIDGWYQFISHNEERPNLQWLLNKAEVAVIRHGARIIQIDPWNRLEHMRDRSEPETLYIGRCLRELHVFANDMDCHVQVIAHPAKMDIKRRGGPPDLEDISGSMNFYNMPDQGFCIHREKRWDGEDRCTGATLYHLKARFSELGWPCEVKLNYDLSTESYVSLENKY